jgi:hypothetical protein
MWKCTNCGDQVEDKYQVCWNCDTEKFNDTEEMKKYERRPIMNKRELIWLVIKGLGLYFLVVAFIGLPDLLMAVSTTYAYSNMLASLPSTTPSKVDVDVTTVVPVPIDGNQIDTLPKQLNPATNQREASFGKFGEAAMSVYKSLLIGPLARFTLFTIAGVYLLKGGEFIFRLLNHLPSTDG